MNSTTTHAEKPPTVLALAGPTASGKTALALAFAQVWAPRQVVEVISVDSALVYQGMDIGTAKPSVAERAALPHHLIDILDPSQTYSAAKFCADAVRLIAEVQARNALPLLVGGTMLYFKALQQGLDEMPAADAAVRADIAARAAAQGWPALHAELARVDPMTAARLPSHDAQRIQRALEVWTVSGTALSAWHQKDADRAATTHRVKLKLVSLEPQERSWLHGRIAQRFDAMLAQGLIAEVAALRARADLHTELPAMRCVGYRQVWQALNAGLKPDSPVAALQPLREAGVAATRQLAKRQLTWLRGMPARQVVSCDKADALQAGLLALQTAASMLR